MPLDLSWLEALVATVEHGSFQSAALKQGVSRGTLRSRVEALEAHVGVPLLVRTIRGVELTDAGRPFLGRARELLREAATLARFADDQSGEVTGEIHMCVPVGMPPQAHALALSQLRQRYPGVRIHFEVHHDPASAGPETDFVLHFGPRETHGDFNTLRLFTFPARLVASPAYLAERGSPRAPEDLKDHVVFAWVAPGDDGTRLPLLAGGSIQVDPAVRSPDIGTLRELAVRGMGIAFVPDPEEAALLVGAEGVVQVLPDVVGTECPLWIRMPTARAGAGRTRAALEITKDIMDWIKQSVPRA